MCNCSNFDGDANSFGVRPDGDNSFQNNQKFFNIGDDVEFMDDDYIDIGSESQHSNAYGDIDDLDADDDFGQFAGERGFSDDTFLNYSHLHEEDADLDIPMMSASGDIDYDDDGMEVALQQAIAEEEDNFVNASGLDFGSPSGDFEGDHNVDVGSWQKFDGEAEEGDGEFDDFLTKRSRARRKLRKKLRKSGMSRSEARKQAVADIPKQKLGSLIKYGLKGQTSPETKAILDKLEAKGVIDQKDGLDKVAEQIQNAMNENEVEGTQTGGDTSTTGGGTAPTMGDNVTQAGGGKGKMGKIIMIVGAVAILGFVGYKFLKK